MAGLAVGIDVGGSSVRAGLVDERGAVVQGLKEGIGVREPEAFVRWLLTVAERLGPEAARAPVAVGFAAQLLVDTGTLAVAPNFGWVDVPMGPMLARAFGRPVRLVNDLDAITYGEARRGAGAGSKDVTCVFVGTGVGMGALAHGRLLEGQNGLATEIGHTKIASPESGRLCGCGERGCLEAYTSGRHLPDLYAQKVAEGARGLLWEELGGALDGINAGTLEGAAKRGDTAARALFAEVADRLGMAIANAVTLLNPGILILGGGVLDSAPSLHDATVGRIRAATARPHLARLRIEKAALGDDAGLVGAGLLALEG